MSIDELLFDDDMEILQEDKKYPQSFAVPMQKHISIKDIWIPAHLLPNRQKALDSDRIRPNLYHTLNKPKVESFLTYKDTEAKKIFVQLHSLNDILYSDFQDNTFKSEHNSSASLNSVNAGKESYIGSLHEHNFNSETQLCDVEANYQNNADPKNSIEIIKKKRADDFISSCSLEASSEHHNGNQQHMLQNPETSRVQCGETAINPVDHNKNKSSDLLYTADQEHHLNSITNETSQLCKTETNCDITTHSACFSETVDLEKASEDSTTSSSFEVLENLPVAYKKEVVEEQPTKQKRQKGKKKKNAVNKAIQLGEFLDSPNVDGYEIPKRDLFYEGLVAQGLCPPIENPYYSKPAKDYEFPKGDSPPPHKKYASSLFEEFVPNENLLSEEPIEYLVSNEAEASNNDKDGALTTLVLENLPDDASKDNIATLMSVYGEIKRISLVKVGKSSKSYVELILQCDVEWIIGCLNDTDPFGASCEKLKCYQYET
ncbi:hypothetical protein JTE90_002258 [Oedothorax gibbosus]|uniref:RRM domain-containing protein n=1 Tax=Oedothorax gibbosus TaxID=931172 RepID=A0AAV6V8D1_9ARAC|nr:hypothetical protein JTE90_002258 [Oedothorax gibbosus]